MHDDERNDQLLIKAFNWTLFLFSSKVPAGYSIKQIEEVAVGVWVELGSRKWKVVFVFVINYASQTQSTEEYTMW